MKRRVCVVTGTRAEYGLLKPVMSAIRQHLSLQLQILATGMHLSPRHGNTVKDLIRDGFKPDLRVPMDPKGDSGAAMADSVARGLNGINRAFKKLRPELVVVLGDRTEILAASIAAVYQGCALAHIHGGDLSCAGIDESVRHAVTKLAHIHFAATARSASRILQMGEKKSAIHTVGAPGLDTILNVPLLSRKSLMTELKVDSLEPPIVLVQHPVTTQVNASGPQISETLKSLADLPNPIIVLYPNSDAGGREIIRRINRWKTGRSNVRAFSSLPHRSYLSALSHAGVLVGNSSSGIIESASFGLPVVNIGIRQKGRERSTNVIDARHKASDIRKALKTALLNKNFRIRAKRATNPYGDGKAGIRIARILASVRIDQSLLQKQFVD